MALAAPILRGNGPDVAGERAMRVDLAAAFRLAARLDWHEAVANHFSLAVSDDGRKFLMNPRWKHFSRVKASDLLFLDADDKTTMEGPNAPDVTAWCIHGAVHAANPKARCVLHLHLPYATALATLADPEIRPIDQNTARFYQRVVYDSCYEGMANSLEEGRRLAALLGDRKVLMMGNHGVLVAEESVALAFDTVYYLERACRTLVLAYSTGQTLNILPPGAAEQTARDWERCQPYGRAHFEEMKRVLDDEDPSYAG
jgi:ribulose-5-phosphate 4-epimerase/fuculose-1-phosphate aldolase